MSWISDTTLPWCSFLALRLLKCGRVPQHVALIMDGNRRYASSVNVDKIQGHTKGFDKLSEVLQWSLDLGIKEVTVYAFSIENFKRSKEEVDGLLELAREKFQLLLDEKEKIMEHGVRIKVIGNKSYLPEDLVRLAETAELMTRHNDQVVLNIAFSYTAQDEITQAVNSALKGLGEGQLDPSDVDLGLLSRCLYTSTSPFPELIIRTSGEARLSDFLLWQGSASYLHFTGVLWPKFTSRDFLWAIFKYQRVAAELDRVREAVFGDSAVSARSEQFLCREATKRWSELEAKLASQKGTAV